MKNVNMEEINKFVDEAKINKQVLKKSMSVVVEWNMDESKPQVFSKVEFAKGSMNLESDQAPFMGGIGRAPNPIQYCLFGMASCFAATFASIAAEKGLEVDFFNVTAENNVNLSQTLGLSNEPIVEQVRLTVEIKSKADRKIIEEVQNLALKRCPGIYCLRKSIPLETVLKDF